jgi:two-component system response regulator DesR
MSVLVVNEHDIVRCGFRLLLAQVPWIRRCVGARSADEAMLLWNRYEPTVAIVELFVGESSGTEICRQLLRARPHASVLLTSLTERISSSAWTAAGASGFVSTGASAQEIAEAIRTVGLGKMLAPGPRAAHGPISSRQREVLRLMAAGATNRQIANTLGLSPHTVKGHTTDLYRRLQARNRAEAVTVAQRVGLLA